jgi:hypothetical protein
MSELPAIERASTDIGEHVLRHGSTQTPSA